MSDAEDAARWRAIKPFLCVSWSHREWWETVAEKGNRRTEEKREEWFWHVILDDGQIELGGTVKAHKDLPTLEAAIDMLRDAASHSSTVTKEKP